MHNITKRLALIAKRIQRDINSIAREGEGLSVPLDESTTEQDKIYYALRGISPSLANSFLQIKHDLQDPNHLSWAGTAHEVRELLVTLLRILAPDEEVVRQPWYKTIPNTKGPTHKQRVQYILQQRKAGSKEVNVAQQIDVLEERISALIRSTYVRASDAAHRFKPREEALRLFKYLEAFLYDLLDLK